MTKLSQWTLTLEIWNMKKPSPDNTAENIEVLKDYGTEVGRIVRVDLSANGSLETLMVNAREAAAAAQ